MERNSDSKILEIGRLVFKHFQNEKKTDLWLITKNPFLGGTSPLNMIKMGRIDKLLKFVKISLDENKKRSI